MATLNELERMQDNAIVSRYMSEIDTKIDDYILRARVSDEMRKDVMRINRFWQDANSFDAALEKMRWARTAEGRRIAEANTEHMNRAPDLQQMIEEIRASDAFTIPAERHADIGFGPYDGSFDKYLAMVLDYAGPNFADEETGSTEWDSHLMRFGRVILVSDDRGFKTACVYNTEDEAKADFKRGDDSYSKWAADEEEE